MSGHDWLEELSDEDRTKWDEFVTAFRTDALEKLSGSAAMISLVDTEGWDVKFAVELGAAIMLDKPIIAIAIPGAVLSERLKRVADEVLYVDIDTEEGRQQIQATLTKVFGEVEDG